MAVHHGLSAFASVMVLTSTSLPGDALTTKVREGGATGGWSSAVQKQIAESEYQITWQSTSSLQGLEASYQAPNRAHNFRTYFTGEAIRLVPRVHEDASPAWEWTLRLSQWGRPEELIAVEPARARADSNRMEYDRGALIEWYVNSASGLEQGFTIAQPPHSTQGGVDRDSHVVLDLALGGTLRPRISENGQAVDFLTQQGARIIHYAHLKVTDAAGRELPARMEGIARPDLTGIRIAFQDDEALYPVTVDPLTTSPAWSAEADQDGAGFGWSVATAGDVNGDGYSDVVAGAPNYDNGEEDEGRAFVYLGSPSGLAISAAWTAEGDQMSAFFGYTCATAADVNGDGYSDVIVGAPNYANGQTNEGRAYLYLGSVSGLAASPAWTAESNQTGAEFGRWVATAGDVNGDGYSDVIVGADLYDNGEMDEGGAFVYLGSSSGLAASPAWTAESNQASANFGLSVATAGDINGDGYSDFIVGADLYDNGEDDEGRAYVYLGSATGLATSPAWTAESDQASARFGHSVQAAGDVNGDGYSDVIVGADLYDNGEMDEGGAFVYLGSSSGLATSPAWTAESNQIGAALGRWVATAGDINGDGYSDVIVGADLYDNGEDDEGRALVYLGSAAGLGTSAAWTAESDQMSALFGQVATAGDVNGDGYSDVVVGANGYGNDQIGEGRAFVYLGSPAGMALSPAWMDEGNQRDAYFGESVATAGDVNGDGYSDVIVGAYGYDNGKGRAGIYLGTPGGLTAPFLLGEDITGGYFGVSVSTAGDVNGDGYSDVIVGAYLARRAYVYLGSFLGPSTIPDWFALGTRQFFGYSVATAGDVNGDGYSDVIIGAPGQSHDGQASVYLGSASGLAGSPAWTVHSDQVGSEFGWSVATAGDVNGDGYSDVVVGADTYEIDGTDRGRIYVYHGSAAGLATSPSWTDEGVHFNDGLGWSVATAGDVNGDGYSDIIAGAFGASVYLGSATGLPASASWTTDIPGSFFGYSVATAGDINGDGYSDVIIGAPEHSSYSGRAFLYTGSPAGLSGAYSWSTGPGPISQDVGSSVASAGDVNGDGYSDIIVGAPGYGSEFNHSNEGRAFVYYGNGGNGLDRAPRQARADGEAPIGLLGRSESETEFRLRAHGRTPIGRGRVRLEAEVKPLGVPFDGSGVTKGPLLDTGSPRNFIGSRVTLDELMSVDPGQLYHWRLRVATDSPLFPRSPWLSLPYNNRTETDLRTPGCRDADLDGWGALPDPQCANGQVPDCNDADSMSWSPPSEAESLMLSHNPMTGITSLTWIAPSDAGGSTSPAHDVLRSSIAPDFGTGSACVESNDGVNTTAIDPQEPELSSVFYYLIRAKNGCLYPYSLGSLGNGSDGTPRTGRDCP